MEAEAVEVERLEAARQKRLWAIGIAAAATVGVGLYSCVPSLCKFMREIPFPGILGG